MKGAEHDSAAVDLRQGLRAARQVLRTDLVLGVDFVPLRCELASLAAQSESESVAGESERPQAQTRPPSSLARPAFARSAPDPVPPSLPLQPILSPVLVESKPTNLNPRQQDTQRKLDQLRARYEKDAPHAKFVTDHHCIVFGDGDPCARLMIIGEAPGAEEDKVGIPFVGRAGQLLEKMLGAMGLPRSRVYITNVLKTRPPNNATPTADEAAACAPYLFEQIKIIGPEAILALGLPATRVLLNTTESMGRLRGAWWNYSDPRTVGYEVPVMPTYHPAFLLRSYTQDNRAKVWSDLQMVMTKLGLSATSKAVANP